MFALAVNRNQSQCQIFNTVQRYRAAIDVCAGRPVGIDCPLQYRFAPFLQVVLAQPLLDTVEFSIKDYKNFRLVTSLAHNTGVGASAKCQFKGIDDQ